MFDYPQDELYHNADDVNFRMQYFRMSDLVSMIANRKLDLFEDDKQLRNYLNSWSKKQKSLFIESLMIKIPTPLFYFDGSQTEWKIIDGIKRLFAVCDFIQNQFKLTDLDYLRDCEGLTFERLNGFYYSRIMDAEVMVYIINPGTPKNVRYNIYRRLNLESRGINVIKIRNVFFRDIMRFICYLADSDLFLNITHRKLSDKRLEDRDYIMRFIAYYLLGYKNYTGNIDLFISEALMKLNYKDDIMLSRISKDLANSIERIILLFGEDALFTRYLGSPNKYLFETLSWHMAKLTSDEFATLQSNRTQFISSYNRLFSDLDFSSSINGFAPDKEKVVKVRFQIVGNLINNFIDRI